MDQQGLGMKHFNRPLFDMIKTANKQIEENYPEMMGKCYIVNAPWVFKGMWAVVKPWLPPRTLLKVEFFGKGDQFKVRMQELIDLEKAPVAFGGTATCPGIDIPWDYEAARAAAVKRREEEDREVEEETAQLEVDSLGRLEEESLQQLGNADKDVMEGAHGEKTETTVGASSSAAQLQQMASPASSCQRALPCPRRQGVVSPDLVKEIARKSATRRRCAKGKKPAQDLEVTDSRPQDDFPPRIGSISTDDQVGIVSFEAAEGHPFETYGSVSTNDQVEALTSEAAEMDPHVANINAKQSGFCNARANKNCRCQVM